MTYSYTLAALLAGMALAPPAAAQIDYRNLDDGRPVPVTDAYPVERRALEMMLPYTVERSAGTTVHGVAPEVSWGVLANTQLSLRLPFAASTGAGSTHGIAGVRTSLLYNLFTESPSLPALSLRGDLHLPAGSLGGRGARAGLSLLGTRSFGAWRAHLNAGWGFADPAQSAAADALARWAVGGAIDRTLFRQSLLLVGSVSTSRVTRGAPTETVAAAGVRWQWNPVMVLDAGLARRLSATGPDLGLTVGISRTLGLRWYAGRQSPTDPARPPEPANAGLPESRSETMYYPGSFNWRFLAQYPEAARLFNAFDYGHAILYERLLDSTEAATRLEQVDYDYLTRDLLVHPPRLGVAEESVAPRYSRLAWKAKSMFDWAHLLHRQIYDIYSDGRLSDSAQRAMVERVTDDYLANADLAFTTAPKQMALMDEAFYSQTFRRRYPRFNGLIWAYHWLQVGLYEPLLRGHTPAEQQTGIDTTLGRFRAMLVDAPTAMPAVMPMTAAIAPTFAARHPRAAVIFDNLHMMHDIISDILASPEVPASRKRAEIYAALARFQDGSRDAMPLEHWRMMGEMMGGIDQMGGPPLPAAFP